MGYNLGNCGILSRLYYLKSIFLRETAACPMAHIAAELDFPAGFLLETLQNAYIGLQLIPTNKVLWSMK